MSSTKNVKGNRVCVTASYTIQDIYALPDGLDLNDKKTVKRWYIKWRTLTIEMKDGTELELCPTCEGETDFKWANNEEIEKAEELMFEYPEDEN
jgi:hypothetical protein